MRCRIVVGLSYLLPLDSIFCNCSILLSNHLICRIRMLYFWVRIGVCLPKLWKYYFCLLFDHTFHEGHLPHCTWDGADHQSWAHERFIWHNNFINIWLKLVFNPEGKWCYILFRNFLFIFVLFLLFSLTLFDSFENSAHVIGGNFNIDKFKALVGTHVVEDDLFYVAVCNQNGNFGFG